jgi:hypothetical protein
MNSATTLMTSHTAGDELGPKGEHYMQDFVLDAGKTSLCSTAKPYAGCGEKEIAFIEKMAASDEDIKAASEPIFPCCLQVLQENPDSSVLGGEGYHKSCTYWRTQKKRKAKFSRKSAPLEIALHEVSCPYRRNYGALVRFVCLVPVIYLLSTLY